ncbi:unnamed protein product [Lepeophtheirus salmonis]|uniref:(salmon louse) hypothetical protein n=1 Tax=Lepeophtheirus salmonis TaxID=72036 RepID=A0A7R8HEW2_LEPSM|nr:unnamed protein product [Lepeophtheirus salmonis]CAF3035474.1 unnamed protein product [Lepeophtheirus salmonis]
MSEENNEKRELQKKQQEKKSLLSEEYALKEMIRLTQKQITQLEVESMEINARIRHSNNPTTSKKDTPSLFDASKINEEALDLNTLNQMASGTFEVEVDSD